jgi:phage tail sheath protein FI
MATTYLTPGVYIEEISTGARPIEARGTSTAAFVGVAPNPEARRNVAVPINNWMQFVRELAPEGTASTPLSQAVYGFFLNGGRRCFVVNVGEGQPVSGGGRERRGLDVLKTVDEVAMVAAPGYYDAGSWDAVLGHCEEMKDRVAILDSPPDVQDLALLTQLGTVAPARPSRRRDAAAAEGAEEVGGGAPAGGGARPRTSDGGYGAFYFPWILVRDPLAAPDNRTPYVFVPPSGHLAGIYARTDATRGVFKAPANEVVVGALDLAYQVTREEQGELNQNGVNCIRMFQRDIRVWGARTLADSASEWRYINVRRLFAMIEESIGQSTRWVVFEPNDVPLWKAIRRDVSAFLRMLWRDGALMGRTQEEAFFVKCDEETNPPESIDAGRVVVMIGIAPVKPAEFIIFRIGQHAGGVEIEG